MADGRGVMEYWGALSVMAFVGGCIACWAARSASARLFGGLILHIPITMIFLGQNPFYGVPADLAFFYVLLMAGLPLSMSLVFVYWPRRSHGEGRLSSGARVFCAFLALGCVLLGAYLATRPPVSYW